MRKQPRQERSRALVNSLIEATGRVIVTRGLDLATTNHVAAEAGVDIASLYQYFGNKEELVEELLRRLATGAVKQADRFLAAVDMDQARPADLIRGALGLGLKLARANPVIHEIVRHPKYLADSQAMQLLEQQFQQRATTYFRRHFRDYPIANLHTRLYVVSVSAFSLVARHLSEPVPMMSDEELVEAMVDMFTPYFGQTERP